jgi:ribose 5-phosphate isomerase B
MRGIMKVAIGADHGGFELKEILKNFVINMGHEVFDAGCMSNDSVDYPEFAKLVCESIDKKECEVGILICGTGLGMSMAANKYNSIRAAVCTEEFTARLSREHNDANILCLGARVIGSGIAQEIVKVWLATEFSGGRHQNRINQFSI